LVNSAFTLAVVVGMTVNDVSGKAIANLGWKEINLLAPVFAGDTLYAESEVLEKRESKSRPTQGIVTVRTRGFKQDGTEVINFIRSALVPKRGHGVGDT
jgi:acyl dehydratase